MDLGYLNTLPEVENEYNVTLQDGEKVKGGFLFFKYVYFSVPLKADMVFDNGKQKLSGFHFYFEENETAQFEEIMNKLFR